MYSKVLRDEDYIENLKNFVIENYGLEVIKIKKAKRGFYGETWAVITNENKYFLKFNYSNVQDEYAKSFAVMDYFSSMGIDFTPKIIKAKNGALYTNFENGVLGVFEWIDGENIENDDTKFFEYDMITKIYSLPKFDGCINSENFDVSVIEDVYRAFEILKNSSDKDFNYLYDAIMCKWDLILFREKRLRELSNRCKGNTNNFYITHGDAGGNFLVNGDKRYIIDWDAPKLAPPERDAWFVSIHKPWAKDYFNKCLKKHGVDYKLDDNRLQFYAYYSYFYYFFEYMTALFSVKVQKKELIQDVISYMSCWIEEQLAVCDSVVL